MEANRVLIIGASGQLGTEFSRLRPAARQLSYPDYDLTKARDDDQIRRAEPAVIINCAAYTAVDQAETEVALATAINATAPGRLAKLAKELGAVLVHISTDYVFDGTSPTPYTEASPTHPINTYGRTKLAGDEAVRQAGGQFLIARTAWLCGGRGPNFILTMLKLAQSRPELKVVTDQIGSPTFTKDLALAVLDLVDQNQTGLFNVVNAGQASRWELVAELCRLAKLPTKLLPAKSADFPTAAARPAHSVLAIDKLTKFHPMRSWQAGLEDYYQQIVAEKLTA